jgi:hypothetical protein
MPQSVFGTLSIVHQNSAIQIGSIEANLRNLRLPIGLNIDEVYVDAESLRWSGSTDQLPTLERPADFTVIVKAPSIAAFLEQIKPAGLSNFVVDVRDGAIHSSAEKKVIISIPATAVVQLAIRGDQELILNLLSAEALGAGVKTLVQTQLEELNPIFDGADFPVDVRFKEVFHESGQVRVIGTLTPK